MTMEDFVPKRPLLTIICCAALLLGAVEPAAAGKSNDTLVWSTSNEIDTADLYYQNLREVVILAHLVCDTLIHHDPISGAYKPLLAESYGWIDDLTLDVTLRKGIKFHNGKAFGAEDVAYTLNYASKPENAVVTALVADWIKSVEVVAPDKVRIHAKHPTPAAFEFLSGVTPIYPVGHYESGAPAADGKKSNSRGGIVPVCTGPYKIEKFTPGQSAELVKNPDYFAASPKGQPSIGKIVYRTIPNAATQVAELITGGLDWIWDASPDNAAKLGKLPNITVKAAPTTRMSFLSLDAAGRSGKNPMQDVRVRRAVYHAIDRQAITRDLVGEGAAVLDSMCAPAQFGCATDVTVYPYDPAKAKALLAEAGYPNGFSMPLYAYRDRPYSEAVVGFLRKVGITADLRFLQWTALRPIVQQDGKAQMAQLTWGSQGILDASASVSNYFEGSADDYARDPEVEAWLKAADSTTDAAKRKDLYAKALKKIADQAYFVPIFLYGRNYAFNSELDYPVTPDELAHFYLAKWK
jgi:peptide/nickel transport system substrate-binding protein